MSSLKDWKTELSLTGQSFSGSEGSAGNSRLRSRFRPAPMRNEASHNRGLADWAGQSIRTTTRLVVREPSYSGQKSLLARHSSLPRHPACCRACRNSQAYRRHTFRQLLHHVDGERRNIKVVQELMRHANCRCTLEIYSQARIQAKREAQHRVVEMIIPGEESATASRSFVPNKKGRRGKVLVC
jgi:hypothetical protein